MGHTETIETLLNIGMLQGMFHQSENRSQRYNTTLKSSNSNRKTLFIHDSIYINVNKNTLLTTTISKKFTLTLRQALDTVRNPHEDRSRIILGVGTNDIKHNIPLGEN